VTVVLCVADPPAPEHVSVYFVEIVSDPVARVPEGDTEPLQPPDAVQDVASVAVHDNVDEPPGETALGLDERATAGAGALTATVVDLTVLPSGPLQVRVNVEAVPSGPVDSDPLVGCAPLQAPEAEQDVALAADHVSVDRPPLDTLDGLAEKLSVGAGADATVTTADCEMEPPGPVQVSVYDALLVNAAVDSDPLVGWAPLQAPEAEQDVALIELQLSVADRPALIVPG